MSGNNYKDIDIKAEAGRAMADSKILIEFLEGLKYKNEEIRYPCFQVLLYISEGYPEILYPEWDFLADMLDSNNAYWKLAAVRLIANLVRVDTENRFEKIFDKYFDLLNDSVIIAGHVTANSGKIATAKPELQSKITDRLLNIDHTTQKHKDLIKSGAIESFYEYFDEAENKDAIIQFVREQSKGESPKTRKTAKEFLQKFS